METHSQVFRPMIGPPICKDGNEVDKGTTVESELQSRAILSEFGDPMNGYVDQSLGSEGWSFAIDGKDNLAPVDET
jgi:hypothetical protein